MNGPVVAVLVERGAVTEAQLAEAKSAQVLYGGSLGANLLGLKHLDEDALLAAYEALGFPRRNVREQALRGIALVGVPADMLQIRDITHRDRDAAMLALVAWVEHQLREPMVERVRQLDSAVAATCPRER